MIDEKILAFLRDAIKKGYSEDYLKQGLISQGWPAQEIEEGISQVKKELSQPIVTEQKIIPEQPKIEPQFKPEEKPQPILTEKPKKLIQFNYKSIGLYSGAFLGVLLVVFLTLSVYSYISGIKNYTVPDPQTGVPVTGHCLQSDPECKLMKSFAMDKVKKSILTNILIGAIVSLLIVIVYMFIPYKKIFVWGVNILYLLTIIIIYIIWLTFARSSAAVP